MKSKVILFLLPFATSISLQANKVEELSEEFHGYQPWYSGFEGNNQNNGQWRDAYSREVPEVFTGETADTFTKKMITDYATEAHDPETGKPNGKFYVDKAKTKQASYEVLATHLDLKGKQADEHLKKYFDKTWEHMDVNNEGRLEAVELNHFMRTLCKPVKEFIQLE